MSHMSEFEPTVVRSIRLLDGLAGQAHVEHHTVNNLIIKILSESIGDRPQYRPAHTT